MSKFLWERPTWANCTRKQRLAGFGIQLVLEESQELEFSEVCSQFLVADRQIFAEIGFSYVASPSVMRSYFGNFRLRLSDFGVFACSLVPSALPWVWCKCTLILGIVWVAFLRPRWIAERQSIPPFGAPPFSIVRMHQLTRDGVIQWSCRPKYLL